MLKLIDKKNQIIKICRFCGFKREYDEYHRIYSACKKCPSIRCAKHYQKTERTCQENLDYIGKQ